MKWKNISEVTKTFQEKNVNFFPDQTFPELLPRVLNSLKVVCVHADIIEGEMSFNYLQCS